jgi:Mn-dependent DtxR family transcriptional regulator
MKYDKETTEKLVSAYNELVAQNKPKLEVKFLLAERFSVPQRSMVAKLSSMGLYHREPYTNKQGKVPVSKAALVDEIAAELGVSAEIVESLEKCNKNVLMLLLNFLKAD